LLVIAIPAPERQSQQSCPARARWDAGNQSNVEVEVDRCRLATSGIYCNGIFSEVLGNRRSTNLTSPSGMPTLSPSMRSTALLTPLLPSGESAQHLVSLLTATGTSRPRVGHRARRTRASRRIPSRAAVISAARPRAFLYTLFALGQLPDGFQGASAGWARYHFHSWVANWASLAPPVTLRMFPRTDVCGQEQLHKPNLAAVPPRIRAGRIAGGGMFAVGVMVVPILGHRLATDAEILHL